MDSINSRIANELGVRPQQVAAAVALLDEGPPFPSSPAIARKSPAASTIPSCVTRKSACATCASWTSDASRSSPASGTGQADPELKREIDLADTKTRLEDLYLPYKQKRRTKGQIAPEAGLGELADALFGNPELNPESEATRFIDAERASPM